MPVMSTENVLQLIAAAALIAVGVMHYRRRAASDRAADEGGLELLQGELGREEGTEADELGMDHGVPRERECRTGPTADHRAATGSGDAPLRSPGRPSLPNPSP